MNLMVVECLLIAPTFYNDREVNENIQVAFSQPGNGFGFVMTGVGKNHE